MIDQPSVVFLGSKASGLSACRVLGDLLPPGSLRGIICPDDRDDARSVFTNFEAFAADRCIVLHLVRTRSETMAALDALRPDLAIVHGWYQILPVEERPQTLFLGFHYSPLPRYRGNAPLVWQIMEGEPEIGISFFELTAELDAGRLVDQQRVPLQPDETIADALKKADAVVTRMLREFASASVGAVTLCPQPNEEPSYCGLRVKEDGRINWSWDAKRIHDFIRAQTRPYPGAFTSLPDGRRLHVWKSAREPRRFVGASGAVVEVAHEHVVVATGRGAVRLVEVQAEGEVAVPAMSVLRSLKIRLG
jgi:methionyl-tRNA formyltransferase